MDTMKALQLAVFGVATLAANTCGKPAVARETQDLGVEFGAHKKRLLHEEAGQAAHAMD